MCLCLILIVWLDQSEAVVLELAQGLTFPGVEYMKDKVMKHGVYEKHPKAIVLNAAHYSNCDYTMVQGITQVCDYFAKHDLTLIIACCSVSARKCQPNASGGPFSLGTMLYEARMVWVIPPTRFNSVAKGFSIF